MQVTVSCAFTASSRMLPVSRLMSCAIPMVRQSAIAEGALIGGGLVYLLAAFLGFVNYLPILAIDSPYAPGQLAAPRLGNAALLLGVLGALQARASLQLA